MINTDQQLANEEQCVIFEIGAKKAAIKLDNIVSIYLLEEIVPIPRSPNHIIGVTNIQDSIIPIINLELLLEHKIHESVSHPIGLIVNTGKSSFCVYTIEVPYIKYLQVAPEKMETDFGIPSQWIYNIYQEDDQSYIPVLDPMKFWISLGSSELIGPSVELKPDEIVQRLQNVLDDKSADISLNEEGISEKSAEIADQVEITLSETEPKSEVSKEAEEKNKLLTKDKKKKGKKKGKKKQDDDKSMEDGTLVEDKSDNKSMEDGTLVEEISENDIADDDQQ